MTEDPKTSPIPLGRGVNISHLFSQRPPQQAKEPAFFSEMDAAFLARSGFDHIRLPVDEEILWDTDANRREAVWDRLHETLAFCRRQDLRVLLDLHIIRSHHFNSDFKGGENLLWTSAEEQEHLVGLWKQLCHEMEGYDTGFLGFEILNEPVSPESSTWNHILNRCHATIRERQPERTIVVGSNNWQKVWTVPELELPEGDPKTVVSFHYYEPGMVTHYKSSWTALGEYEGSVRYPGIPFPPDEVPEDPSEKLSALLAESNRHYDREVILNEVRIAVDHARSLGMPAYCGEWGCILRTPREVRLAWYRDVVDVFQELGVGWAIWDYKGGFNIVEASTQRADHELIHILTNP